MDIRIPRLGEGVSFGTVVNILVAEGDEVKKDQTIMEIETEKAVAPIPSPESGRVTKIYVKQGDTVPIGQPVIALAVGSDTGQAPQAKVAAARNEDAPKSAAAVRKNIPEKINTLVPGAESGTGYRYQSKSGFPPPASPAIRKLAGDLGIDLNRVKGSERGGRIVLADLKNYIQQLQRAALEEKGSGTAGPASAKPPLELPDFSKWGPVLKKPLSNLRKTIGQKMVESWTTVPHVTQFDEANIAALMELRKKYSAAYEKKGARLTLTGFILRAAAAALKKYPLFNSSLDEAAGEIILKEYYHLGVAVDTEAGLIVPVIRDVDKKSLLEISVELAQLAEKTRRRKISVEELQGGTFNISNLGSIGGTHFTPIVTRPQVAVLGVGRGILRPVLEGEKVKAANMLPLGLSYDHRVIDGADGARFIREIVAALENFDERQLKI